MTLRTRTIALFIAAFSLLILTGGLFLRAQMTHSSTAAQLGLVMVVVITCLMIGVMYAYVLTIQPRHRKARSSRRQGRNARNTPVTLRAVWNEHGRYIGVQEVAG